jgi:hypothetical protein
VDLCACDWLIQSLREFAAIIGAGPFQEEWCMQIGLGHIETAKELMV